MKLLEAIAVILTLPTGDEKRNGVVLIESQ